MSNIYLNKIQEKFVVSKIFGGKSVNFGQYDSLDDAEKVVDLLNLRGWCVGNLFDIQEELFGEIVSTRKLKNLDKM